jgi:hypothetical protein
MYSTAEKYSLTLPAKVDPQPQPDASARGKRGDREGEALADDEFMSMAVHPGHAPARR